MKPCRRGGADHNQGSPIPEGVKHSPRLGSEPQLPQPVAKHSPTAPHPHSSPSPSLWPRTARRTQCRQHAGRTMTCTVQHSEVQAPIGAVAAVYLQALRTLLLGNASCAFSQDWTRAHFRFCEPHSDLAYALEAEKVMLQHDPQPRSFLQCSASVQMLEQLWVEWLLCRSSGAGVSRKHHSIARLQQLAAEQHRPALPTSPRAAPASHCPTWNPNGCSQHSGCCSRPTETQPHMAQHQSHRGHISHRDFLFLGTSDTFNLLSHLPQEKSSALLNYWGKQNSSPWCSQQHSLELRFVGLHHVPGELMGTASCFLCVSREEQEPL